MTASLDQTARLWAVPSGGLVAELRGHADRTWSGAFSRDGRLVVTASGDGTARVWSARTGMEVQVLRGHGESVWSAAFSADGKFVVTASDDRTARVWEVASGRIVSELRGHTDRVVSAEFSRDGRRVVTASWDKTARVYACELCVPLSGLLDIAKKRIAEARSASGMGGAALAVGPQVTGSLGVLARARTLGLTRPSDRSLNAPWARASGIETRSWLATS